MTFTRILSSAQERARYFVTRRRASGLRAELGLEGVEGTSLELLETLATIRTVVGKAGGTLIDVGAHRGAFSEAAAHVLGASEVVCFEPDPKLLDPLRARLAGLPARVHAVALSDRCGEAVLHLHPDPSMNSLLSSDAETLSRHFSTTAAGAVTECRVPVRTLDEVIGGSAGLPRPFFLKIDTQGNELDVLRGASRTLGDVSACLVEYIFCTPYQGASGFRDLIDFLADHGLACRAVTGLSRRPTHDVSGVDFLFVRPGAASR